MAFEDRCSPQSAPSPPGVPHSPHNTAMICTSSSTVSSDLNNGSNHSLPTNSEMALDVCDDRMTPSPSSQPQSPIIVHVKQEDELDNNNMITSNAQPDIPIPFSITNILSNTFGKITRKSTTERKLHLFRPYDTTANRVDVDTVEIQRQCTPPSSPRKASNNNGNNHGDQSPHLLTPLQQQHLIESQHAQHQFALQSKYNGIIDYSNRAAAAQAFLHNNNLEHAKFLQFYSHHQNQLNLAAAASAAALYPRIHDDLLNSKKYHQYYQPQATPILSESALSKIPPLGNLCKTVSQIGQPAAMTVAASALASPTTSVKSAISTAGSSINKSPISIPPVKKGNHGATLESGERLETVATSMQQKEQLQKNQQASSLDSGMESSDDTKSESGSTKDGNGSELWPAWIYCTRYSDRPSSGPRYRKPKEPKDKTQNDEKRPRTAFSMEQLARLKREFTENKYLTERRRQQLSSELGLNEAQIKIWFQNKRAKIKKSTGQKNPLAMQLMAQGLYNHSTVPLTKEEEELEMRMNGQM